MHRKTVFTVGAIVLCSMIFTMVFMSMSEEDLSVALTAFRGSTQDVAPTETEKIIREIEKEDEAGGLGLGEVGTTTGDPDIIDTPAGPYVPGLNSDINVPEDLKDLIMLPFEQVYPMLVGTDDESYSYENLRHWSADTESKLLNIQATQASTFSVNVWTWAEPGNQNNLAKVSTTKQVTCNNVIRPLVEAAFEEIYNSPQQPVITMVGGYSIRHMASGGGNTSGHAFGCTIDINWESYMEGCGNRMSSTERSPSPETWQALPECQTKYEIFYEGCPVVNIFKSYGFYWGGNWSSYTDGMHFGFIGDNGTKARLKGQEAYNSVQGGN